MSCPSGLEALLVIDWLVAWLQIRTESSPKPLCSARVGVGWAAICCVCCEPTINYQPTQRGGLGKFSLSRLHFFDSGCTFCSKLKKKKNWKNSFKEIGWIMDIHTIRGFEMAWLVCCPLPWFSRFIWPIWLVSWLVICSLVKEGFWTLAPWSGRGEVGTQSEQRPPGG